MELGRPPEGAARSDLVARLHVAQAEVVVPLEVVLREGERLRGMGEMQGDAGEMQRRHSGDIAEI